MTATIALPLLAGTRAYAAQIAADAEIVDTTVILDFTATTSVAQGFCDELVKGLCAHRGLRIVRVIGDNPRAYEFVTRALRLRQLDPLPPVVTIPDVAVTRWAAEPLVEATDFTGGDVVLDFTERRVTTRDFCDALVGHVIAERAGRVVAVIGATIEERAWIHGALRVRGAQGILAS